jgi:hypothetical protein
VDGGEMIFNRIDKIYRMEGRLNARFVIRNWDATTGTRTVAEVSES